MALKLVNHCFRALNKPTNSTNASVNILCNFSYELSLNICRTFIILSQQQGQVCLFSIYLCMQNQSFACRFSTGTHSLSGHKLKPFIWVKLEDNIYKHAFKALLWEKNVDSLLFLSISSDKHISG